MMMEGGSANVSAQWRGGGVGASQGGEGGAYQVAAGLFGPKVLKISPI